MSSQAKKTTKVQKFKFNNSPTVFLVYGELEFPYKRLDCELLEKKVNLFKDTVNHQLPIMFVNDLLIRSLGGAKKIRTRDVILCEYQIESFYDLQCCYNSVMHKESHLPKSVRDHVVSKYSEIINM